MRHRGCGSRGPDSRHEGSGLHWSLALEPRGGSHFNWTHSTGRVLSMRSSPLVLLLLIGVQAVLNMGGGRALSTAGGGAAANHKAGQQTAAANHRAGQQTAGDRLSEHRSSSTSSSSSNSKDHQRTSSGGHVRTRRPHHRAAPSLPSDSSSIPEVDPKLFSKRRYRSSPRVVFSEVAPSHHALEEEEGDGGGMMKGARVRRRSGSQPMHRGEYSVCDSIGTWVGNLTQATDIGGREVTVLPNVKIDNVVKKQFFYETTCRSPTAHGRPPAIAAPPKRGKQGNKSGGGNGGTSGCRGIDARHWNSYCTNTHTYVRALTIFKNQTAWRLIRINAACVCVLSRKSWGGRLGH